jgi:hopanoid biosynthesis associated protein HpnK
LKRLIVNADDFGYTTGVNRAIVSAHRTGIVTSTSLMANGKAFPDAVERWKENPSLDVGCHVNFVEGRPVSAPEKVPHLVNSAGEFHGLARFGLRLATGRVPEQEMERELSAQIETILAAGIIPSHVDTHQHIHLHPLVAAVVERVGKRYGIGWIRRVCENCLPPWREGAWSRRAVATLSNLLAAPLQRQADGHGLRTPDAFSGFVLTGRLSAGALQATLALLPEGVTELMCHPGYCDPELSAAATSLKQQREVEFRTVADGCWTGWLKQRGIELTNFRDLKTAQ